jgi:hypothetical protein
MPEWLKAIWSNLWVDTCYWTRILIAGKLLAVYNTWNL